MEGTESHDKDGDSDLEPVFGEIGILLPLGTLEVEAGIRSYQDRDEASSTDHVACKA